METTNNTQTSNHSFWKVFLLALFLGFFGAHRFAVGKIKSGLLQLVTFGGLGIWALIDDLMILLGKFSDSKGFAIPNPNPRASWAAFVLAFLLGVANNSNDKKASVTSTGDGSPAAQQYDQKKSKTDEATTAEAKALPEWLASGRWECVDATEGLMKGATLEFGTNTVTVKHSGEHLVTREYKVVAARKGLQPGVTLSADLMVDGVRETFLQFPSKDGFDTAGLTWNKQRTTLSLVRRTTNDSQEGSKKAASTGKPVQQRSVAGRWISGDAKILLGAGGSFMYQHPLRNFYGKWETSNGEYIKITFRDGTSTLSRYDADSDKLNHLGGTFRRE